LRRKAEVIVTSRTPERSHLLAQQMKCLTVEWERRHALQVEILINCTPLGMHPHVDETPYNKTAFKPGSIVFDTVYNPENTLFIKDARDRDCFVVTGVDMFVRQAALQYKLFTGQDAPEKAMRDVLKRATSAAKF
jgi:3-dehydroquinate dehydratase/shikimate dehydrogenase